MSHGHNFSILHWHFLTLKGFPYWASSVTTVTVVTTVTSVTTVTVFPSPSPWPWDSPRTTHLGFRHIHRHSEYTKSAENFDFDSWTWDPSIWPDGCCMSLQPVEKCHIVFFWQTRLLFKSSGQSVLLQRGWRRKLWTSYLKHLKCFWSSFHWIV